MKRILKSFKKLRFFDQNLYRKLTFHNFLLNISWISDSVPKVIPLEDNISNYGCIRIFKHDYLKSSLYFLNPTRPGPVPAGSGCSSLV